MTDFSSICKNAGMSEFDKTYIILDRHPESVGNETGDHRNDASLGITDLGKKQARAQAEFMMNELFPRIGITHLSQVDIWASDYERVQQGLNIKIQRMYEIDPDFVDLKQIVHADDSLMERNFGKLAYSDHLINDVFKEDPDAQKRIQEDLDVSKMVYAGTPHSAKPEMGESHKEIGGYVRHWRNAVQRNIEEGRPYHWTNMHGDTKKQVVAQFLHQYSTPIPTPGNCDVTLISGTPKNMTVQRVYDGEKMKSCFESGKFFAKPKRLGDLPFAQELDI